ncbi:potassium transporter Kup, partial [Massilia sp. CMS3.1]|uniref:KUP/HAK/KT family potassium transporter n=1 Tax=Massilia sp. CMS3.1 TaxID=3373083 RepID=UPI003EE65454
KVLHERVVFVTVTIEEQPFVPQSDQANVESLGHNCYQVSIRYGFKDEPDIPLALAECAAKGHEFHMMETSFFIARQTVISTPGAGMSPWREHLFVSMSRNARSAADYYQIPPNRVIELGTQVEI